MQLVVALCVASLVAPCGCVRRRLLVRSNPPGATVYVDNQPIGVTPCATSFTYYGTRELRLVKPGFETLTINQPIPAPWYQIPPIDFVSENVVPKEIQDYRTVTYTLAPAVIQPTEQLLDRAQQLRSGTQQGAVLPVGATTETATDAVSGAPALGPPVVQPQSGQPVLNPALPPSSGETLGPGVITPPGGGGTLPPGGAPVVPQ
jgi:hypothetical protein